MAQQVAAVRLVLKLRAIRQKERRDIKELLIANKYRSVALGLAAFAVAGTAPAFAQSSGTWSAGISTRNGDAADVDGWRPVMFDYHNLNTDYRRPLPPDPGDAWVWIAGAILLLLVLAAAFVSYYEPIQPPCRSSCSMSQPG